MEVRALPAEQVDDLDIVAFLDFVGAGGGARHFEIQPRIRERIGQQREFLGARGRARDAHLDLGRRALRLRRHRLTGRRHDQHARALRGELFLRARRAVAAEQPHGLGLAEIDVAAAQAAQHRARALRSACEDGAQAVGDAADLAADQARVDPARRIRGQHFARLPAFDIDDGDPVAARDRDHRRAAARHAVALDPAGQVGHAAIDQHGQSPFRERRLAGASALLWRPKKC